MGQETTNEKERSHNSVTIELKFHSYNDISSVVALALCVTMSFAGSLPVARSTMRGMKTKAIGTAIEMKDIKIDKINVNHEF